ncbi:hypothetical protein SHXM_09327 [Streptomyces hygroscopicus]|nr:hypothetical protein SHXM_09327 [Streptomyces hygroscopicus]
MELHHVAGMRRTSRWAWQPVGGVLGNAGGALILRVSALARSPGSPYRSLSCCWLARRTSPRRPAGLRPDSTLRARHCWSRAVSPCRSASSRAQRAAGCQSRVRVAARSDTCGRAAERAGVQRTRCTGGGPAEQPAHCGPSWSAAVVASRTAGHRPVGAGRRAELTGRLCGAARSRRLRVPGPRPHDLADTFPLPRDAWRAISPRCHDATRPHFEATAGRHDLEQAVDVLGRDHTTGQHAAAVAGRLLLPTSDEIVRRYAVA